MPARIWFRRLMLCLVPALTTIEYSPTVHQWLHEYEAEYGPRGVSELTTDKIPLEQTCGPARVIDVRRLAGGTRQESWPASPEITAADVQRYEKQQGDLKPGDIVIFQTGWSDQYYRALPEGRACLEEPLNGKREGWPAPGPDAIRYLADKKIRCIGSDAPTLGGVEPKRALMTYWALGSSSMVGVEFLANLDRLPQGAYFLFAASKIKGCHGGPGRAIALY